MYAHNYAVEIEFILRDIFGCERDGVGGLANADTIESNWYAPIACGLGYVYSRKQREVNAFIREYHFYLAFGLRGLLSFESNSKEIDNCEYSLGEYSNGEEAVKDIIKAFRLLVTK